jgi:hypothetical protein
LGVPPELVRPLGRLEPVPVAVSRYLIVPFVGFTQAPPVLRPDPAEVSRVVEVPLDDVTERRRLVTEPWKLRGSSWRVTYYRFGDTVVWGATARVLGHLAARLDPRFSDVDPAPGDVTPA